LIGMLRCALTTGLMLTYNVPRIRIEADK